MTDAVFAKLVSAGYSPVDLTAVARTASSRSRLQNAFETTNRTHAVGVVMKTPQTTEYFAEHSDTNVMLMMAKRGHERFFNLERLTAMSLAALRGRLEEETICCVCLENASSKMPFLQCSRCPSQICAQCTCATLDSRTGISLRRSSTHRTVLLQCPVCRNDVPVMNV